MYDLLAVTLIFSLICIVVMATIALVCRLLLHTGKLVDRFVGASTSRDEERLSLTRSTVQQPTTAGDIAPICGGTFSGTAIRPATHQQTSVYGDPCQMPHVSLYVSSINSSSHASSVSPPYVDHRHSPVNNGCAPSAEHSPVAAGEVLSLVCDSKICATKIQRALSCDSVISDTELDGAEEQRPRNGQLEFGLTHRRESSELIVNIIAARDLEKDKVTGTLDSYIRLWLAPHKEGKYQTKIQKDTDSPQYREQFVYRVSETEVDDKTIQLQAYSCDKYARHKLLGETELRLGDIDLRHPVRLWMDLHDMDEKPIDYGDVMFSMSYLPTAERLTLVIAKARNLKWPVSKVIGDCCVKVYLLKNGKKIAKKKTSNKHEDRNPIFNESVSFSVPQESLDAVQIKINAIVFLPDHGGVQPIGHVLMGSKASGTELVHWTQTMTSLRRPVTMWHRLQK